MALASLAAQLASVPESDEVKDLLCGIRQLLAGCNKEAMRVLARRWQVPQKLHGKNKSLKVLSEDIQKQLRQAVQAVVGVNTGASEPGGVENVGEDTGAGEAGGVGDVGEDTGVGEPGGEVAKEMRRGRRWDKRQRSPESNLDVLTTGSG